MLRVGALMPAPAAYIYAEAVTTLSESGRSVAQRRRVRVSGIVQGVGFRPFVYGLARAQELGGFVRNDARGVVIEVEGTKEKLDLFAAALVEHGIVPEDLHLEQPTLEDAYLHLTGHAQRD